MIVQRSDCRTRGRSGFGLVELAITGALLVAAMVITLQVVGWIALDRRASERRERAVLEASNLMERITSRPWNDLSTEKLASMKVSDSSSTFLAGPTLSLKVEPFDDAPPRKRITVEIRWRDRSGRPEAPVRLVAWSYRQRESGQ